MTGDQCQYARRLLGMTHRELANRSGVPTASLSLYELTSHLSAERVAKLQGVLESSGATFAAHGVLIDYDVRGILSRAQCRTARALLNWAQHEVALESGLSTPTVSRFEIGRTYPDHRTLAAIRAALEQAGVEFTNGEASGVKLRKAET